MNENLASNERGPVAQWWSTALLRQGFWVRVPAGSLLSIGMHSPKELLDSLIIERESILATMAILTDRDLTDRLLRLSGTIDDDVAAGRLLKTADVFGAL